MKTIKQLKTQDGQYITNQKEILNEQFHYYNNLYKNSMNDQTYDNNVFFNVPSKSLTDKEKQLCEGLLTEYECKKALDRMQNQKSPGSDGFTFEFYRHFWPLLKIHIVKSLKCSYTNGKLSQLQGQGFISLIPKQGTDLDTLTSHRYE